MKLLGPIKHCLDSDASIAHRLWSVWVALFWGLFSGAYMALPVFQDAMSPWTFALLCVVMSIVFVVARITKQPGLD